MVSELLHELPFRFQQIDSVGRQTVQRRRAGYASTAAAAALLPISLLLW